MERKTARELLQHRFIRTARSTSRLVELIERHQAFRKINPSKPSTPSRTLNKQAEGFGMTIVGNRSMKSEWNFDETIRGTVRGVPLQLDLAEMEEEEWDLEEKSGNTEWILKSGRPSSLLARRSSHNVSYSIL